jgi:methylisocitrate lyase
MARTDAAGVEGLPAAIARAQAYVAAGADMIFPEAMQNEKEFAAMRKALKVPLLANMTEFGKTPFFTAREFQDMGYRMVIWPVSHLRVAAKAVEELYGSIKANGGTHKMVDRMQTRAELYATIGYHDYEALDQTLVKTIIPQAMPQRG